jgi:hypothetical protein
MSIQAMQAHRDVNQLNRCRFAERYTLKAELGAFSKTPEWIGKGPSGGLIGLQTTLE